MMLSAFCMLYVMYEGCAVSKSAYGWLNGVVSSGRDEGGRRIETYSTRRYAVNCSDALSAVRTCVIGN